VLILYLFNEVFDTSIWLHLQVLFEVLLHLVFGHAQINHRLQCFCVNYHAALLGLGQRLLRWSFLFLRIVCMVSYLCYVVYYVYIVINCFVLSLRTEKLVELRRLLLLPIPC
jgi:hypothetical protein